MGKEDGAQPLWHEECTAFQGHELLDSVPKNNNFVDI